VARPGASMARSTRWSTTTGPASHWWRSSPSPSSARATRRRRWPAPTSPTCASCCWRSESPTCAWTRVAAVRRERLAAPARPRGVRHPYGDQERQLAALGRARGRSRDLPPGDDPGRGRHHHAGDPALARGHRTHHGRPGQVRRRGLPLLPRARPRAACTGTR
jgi:hypothetical protein